MKVVFDDVSHEWIVRFSIDDISLNPKFQCLLPLVADFILSEYRFCICPKTFCRLFGIYGQQKSRGFRRLLLMMINYPCRDV